MEKDVELVGEKYWIREGIRQGMNRKAHRK